MPLDDLTSSSTFNQLTAANGFSWASARSNLGALILKSLIDLREFDDTRLPLMIALRADPRKGVCTFTQTKHVLSLIYPHVDIRIKTSHMITFDLHTAFARGKYVFVFPADVISVVSIPPCFSWDCKLYLNIKKNQFKEVIIAAFNQRYNFSRLSNEATDASHYVIEGRKELRFIVG